ncbi:hypothetical protein [Jeotgalibacillus proteolyticus]|uniref:Uncharacterized protein n=1 Tax=Jeotgalibacillus proteolyticus TaxID=2082395 RepID=A0A2S5GBT3_9BACL|nr:hypothetical protein [Jeotgalibacillus proteolyticus]PPA70353.1 hypothetical protein C4B60_12300 [Jeotgalibacillus proteolyticus]
MNTLIENLLMLLILLLILSPYIAISVYQSRKYKHTEKVDKGSEVTYYKLSYRRKFIRSLWILLFTLIIIFLYHLYSSIDIERYIFIIAVIILYPIVQLAYTFSRWKNGNA